MRVILKPASLFIILGTILALACLSYKNWQKAEMLSSFQKESYMTGENRVGASAAHPNLLRKPKPGEIISPDMQRWTVSAFPPARAKRTEFQVADAPWKGSTHATRVTTTAVDPNRGIKSVELVQVIPVYIAQGQVIHIDFWARSSTSSTTEIGLIGDDASTEEIKEQQILTSTWQHITYSLTARQDHKAGTLCFIFRLGKAVGEAEFAQVRVDTQ